MSARSSNEALFRAIAFAYGNGQQSAREAMSNALQALMDEVGCPKVSIWRFEIREDNKALRCFASKVSNQPMVEDATLLNEAQYREYFAALVQRGIFVSNDAQNDSKLMAMRGVYLRHHCVGALLDVPIAINGRAYGIVCCEHIDTPFRWSAAQIRSAREAVIRAGLLIGAEPLFRLETVDSLPLAPF